MAWKIRIKINCLTGQQGMKETRENGGGEYFDDKCEFIKEGQMI